MIKTDKEWSKQTEKIIAAMEGVHTRNLELEQLFNESFMRQHTFSRTIRDFISEGNLDVKCVADFEKISEEKLNAFVQEKTGQFETFYEFYIAARRFWLEYNS